MLNNQLKTIVFIPAWYPHKQDAMYGLFIQRHAEAIAALYNVIIIYPQGYSDSETIIDLTEEKNLTTIRIYYKKYTLQIPLISNFIRMASYFYYLNKAYTIAETKYKTPDLSHVHILTRAGVFAIYLKLRFGIKYVITEHWSRYLSNPGTYKGAIRKWLTKKVVKNAEAVTSVSNYLIDAMRSHQLNNSNYSVINNVVDTALFYPSKEPAPAVKEFINISCLEDKSKNISGLIKVIAQLSQQRKDFVCYIVGDGIDRQVLVKMATDLGIINKYVVFTGQLEGAVLADRLRKSLFLVSNSNYENMPVVISEAFACGLPVLATDVGGIHEHINATNGILIPKNNEHKLIEKLNYMLDNYSHFDKEVIRKYAVEMFSKEAVAAKFDVLYKNALAKK